MRAGRKSEAQTPAPIEDRIYGSSKNAPNTATRSNADKIVLSEGIENTLRAKLDVFLKDNPDQKGTITLSDLKAVFRRGAGAYSKSHRPTITGGVPNSRNAWAYARVNKFLQKAGGMKVKKAYIQDDDLMKYKDGGNVPFNIHREFNEYVDKLPKFGYHGTQSKTLINPRPSKDGRYGEGFYLTLNPETAEYFGRFTKTSQGYSKESDSANVFEFDLRGLNLKYYKRAEDMPYIDFDELDKKNYDGIYLYNEGEIVIFNIYKLQEGKLIKSVVGTTYNTNNPDIRFEDGGETPVFGSVENSPYRGFTEEQVMAYDFPEIYKIAEKHHMGSNTIHTEFIKGVFHEQEHTSDWGLSAHTSLQHLWEVPDYYTKLDAVKLAKGGKVKKGKGDCYQTSGTIAMDGGIRGVEFVGKPYVVHAEVRGQGDLMGVRFGHSWVEDDEFVYDYSNGKDLKIPKFFYYYLGDIQKVEPKYYRYTFAQAIKKMLESGHFGSWELETESGL